MSELSEGGGELRENRHHPDFHREKQSAEMLRQRLSLIIAGFLVLFIALTIRATNASFADAEEFKTSNGTKKAREHRPDIIDRNGELIATNLRVASVYGNPQEIINLDEAVTALNKVMPEIKPENLKKDLSRDSKFAWIKRNITPQEQQAIIGLGIPGVYFSNEDKRVYPSGRLLSHTLGYVDIDSNGIAGVERYMDHSADLEDGDNLQLSIDLRVQHVLYDELSKQFEKFKAAGATAIIADVNSGEVIGMVSLPDFDPNFPSNATSIEKFNIATLGSYEMGSTFKGITAAMAFDYGTSDPTRIYDATNPVRVGGHNISDYHAKKRPLTVTEILMYSSNIGAAKMGLEVGAEKQQEFLKKLGFYEKTDLELSELGRPQFPKVWRELNVATIAFGHGFAITPAHLVKGYIPIVNGGISLPLTLLKRNPYKPVEGVRVMAEKSSRDTTNILREIVLGGSGKNADAEGYLVGGKTGTAEKLTNGRYDKGKLLSSFIATFPVSKPKYMILVIFDDPKEEQRYVRPTGGVTAAPVVKNVVSRIGPILGLKPEPTEDKDAKKNLFELIENASGLVHDSRKVQKGFVFFALKGAKFDGHDHIAQAVAAGAGAVVGEYDLNLSIPYLRSENIRHDLAIAAAKFYPNKLQIIVAVTGTNGKTSTADFTRQLWEMQGLQAASVGTLGLIHGGKTESFGADNTSPDPLVLHEKLSHLKGNLVIEASSIGLEQHRLDGLDIGAGAFTNFTQDHLDYHGDMEEYFRCKTLLFTQVMQAGIAVLNKNIPEFAELQKICKNQKIISFGHDADLQVLQATPHTNGQEIELQLFGKKSTHNVQLIGGFQLENILASIGLTQIYEADLSHLKPVEGRMQFAADGVYVDYAHTPDALENALKSLRPHTNGKLHVVFGCGGDRDKGKRPQMGKIALDLADFVYVTDDNPRTENTSEIRKQIMASCPSAHEIADRKKAIEAALNARQKGDIVLIAGKGHEKYQIIGAEKHYFDDIAVVKELN